MATQKSAKPTLSEWLDTLGITTKERETGSQALYDAIGTYNMIGLEEDNRDWKAIMSSPDPEQAAFEATAQAYGGSGTVKLTKTGGMLVSPDGTPLTSELGAYRQFGIQLKPADLLAQLNTISRATPAGRAKYDEINNLYQQALGNQQSGGLFDSSVNYILKDTATKTKVANVATVGQTTDQTTDNTRATTTNVANVADKVATQTTTVASRPENVQKVFDLVVANPSITDAEIASAMQTYNVTPAKLAPSFGLSVADLQSLYKAAAPSVYTAENVNKLASQILAQNTTNAWKGGLPPETAARYMADDLAKSGISDISQVSKGTSGIVNAMTGDKLISGYGERTKGNLWSGSYEGDGNTGFGVQFTESGAPIFYTEGASSSTLKKDLLKAAVIAGAAFGVFGGESLASIYGSGAAVGEGLTAAEAFAAGLTPAQAAAAGLTGAELAAAGYTAADITAAGLSSTAATGLLTGTADVVATNVVADAATTLTASQLADAAKMGLTAAQYASLLTTGAQTAAGLLQQQTSREAAQRAQAMIDRETAAAKTAAQFRPIGMTTRFGTSQFQVDPVTGQLTSAGYTLSPEAKAAQDRLVALAGQGLTQAEQAQQQFAPLQTGAQRLFGLGNQYLAQSPQEVAQNYLNQQMALLQPGRELELANLQNRLQQQGRGGLAVAQGGTLGATTPELQALFNARAQQEAQLAAQAQQAGQQQVAFGAGLLGTGAQTMGQYYGGQQAAYAPYTTALGQVQALETAAQQPLQLGAALGQTASTAGARMGQLGLEGARQSVALATGADATRNPYASALFGASANPMFGQALGGLFGSQPATSGFSYGKYGTGVDPSTGEYFGSLYF